MTQLNLKSRLVHLRGPKAQLSAPPQLFQRLRDWLVLEGQARARASLNRGYRMWE